MKKMGNMNLDIDSLSIEEMNDLIAELRRVRARKNRAHDINVDFEWMFESIGKEGFSFCNKQTGEVLRAKDWVLYDERDQVVRF